MEFKFMTDSSELSLLSPVEKKKSSEISPKEMIKP